MAARDNKTACHSNPVRCCMGKPAAGSREPDGNIPNTGLQKRSKFCGIAEKCCVLQLQYCGDVRPPAKADRSAPISWLYLIPRRCRYAPLLCLVNFLNFQRWLVRSLRYILKHDSLAKNWNHWQMLQLQNSRMHRDLQMYTQTNFLNTYAYVFFDDDINLSFISPGKFPDLYQSYMHHHLQTTG